MPCCLSKTEISSFRGNVIPLQLISDTDLSKADIRWSCDGDILSIHTFSGEEEECFNDGILLTLKDIGTTTVTAQYESNTYSCTVTVREGKKAEKGDKMQFFAGDFHDHTSELHKHELFAAREKDFPIDYLNKQKEDGRLDFAVISDHAIVTNRKDFFRGFTDLELAEPMSTVIFPGSESEVTFIEADRFGRNHKNAGEIVCVNANNFNFSRSWEPFWEAFSDAPYAVCVLAHPQVVGWDKNGIWNFQLHKNNTPLMKQLIKGVEMGQGNAGCMLYEHIYSVALDCGFKVSTTCSSDCHGPNWGYDAWPGKTVIMAPEKSGEMFLDALWNRRFYATESGNVKLWYTVNDAIAGETLPITNNYKFRIELDYFKEDPTTVPVTCQVISDRGLVVKTVTPKEFSDFTVISSTARYFYLRLVDEKGRKTWSAPVWTGREADSTTLPDLIPLDKENITATDQVSGTKIPLLLNNNPGEWWDSDHPTAEIILDLNKVQKVSAVGHCPPHIVMSDFQTKGINGTDMFARFADEYEISVSTDGEHYTFCADGRIRVHGGEVVIPFPEAEARYIKFTVKSTVGKTCGYKAYENANLSMGELTVFTLK
ncbi:MAG: discoidin domain-containing protein [Clostridia bacterium]|nr:discoidin domain-containing protein [Clostridia bacterium]